LPASVVDCSKKTDSLFAGDLNSGLQQNLPTAGMPAYDRKLMRI